MNERIKSAVFGAKPSENARVELCIERFNEDIALVNSLEAQNLKYLASLRSFSEASKGLTELISKTFLVGTAAERDRSDLFAGAHKEVDENIPSRMGKIALELISNPLKEWAESMENIKGVIKSYKEARKSFDHYTRKVEKLREARKKAKGPEKPKDIERMIRNEGKLEEAKERYETCVNKLVSDINAQRDMRTKRMTPLLTKIIQFQREYFKQCHLAMQLKGISVPSTPETGRGKVVDQKSLRDEGRSPANGSVVSGAGTDGIDANDIKKRCQQSVTPKKEKKGWFGRKKKKKDSPQQQQEGKKEGWVPPESSSVMFPPSESTASLGNLDMNKSKSSKGSKKSKKKTSKSKSPSKSPSKSEKGNPFFGQAAGNMPKIPALQMSAGPPKIPRRQNPPSKQTKQHQNIDPFTGPHMSKEENAALVLKWFGET